MTEPELAALIRKEMPDPRASSLSDRNLVEALFRQATVTGNDHILQFLKTYQVGSTSIFMAWKNRYLTGMQADQLEEALRASKALHEMDNISRAHAAGVPREVLGEMRMAAVKTAEKANRRRAETDEAIRLEKARTDEAIRLAEAQANVQVNAEVDAHKRKTDVNREAAEWHERGQAGINLSRAARAEIDALIVEVCDLERNPGDAAAQAKLSFRKKVLEDLQRKYHEQFGA